MQQLITDGARWLRSEAEQAHQKTEAFLSAWGSLADPPMQGRAEGLVHLTLDHDRNWPGARSGQDEDVVLGGAPTAGQRHLELRHCENGRDVGKQWTIALAESLSDFRGETVSRLPAISQCPGGVTGPPVLHGVG